MRQIACGPTGAAGTQHVAFKQYRIATPSCARWYWIAQPMTPPPMITTSAEPGNGLFVDTFPGHNTVDVNYDCNESLVASGQLVGILCAAFCPLIAGKDAAYRITQIGILHGSIAFQNHILVRPFIGGHGDRNLGILAYIPRFHRRVAGNNGYFTVFPSVPNRRYVCVPS